MTRAALVPSINLRPTSLLRITSRPFSHRRAAAMFAAIAFMAVLVMPVASARAQQAPLHLNPAVEKLARGEAIIGTQTDDMSLQNCHSLARLDFDYAYVDMEHGPLNLDGLAYCVAAMVDKAAILKKGNAQPKVALFARFPPYGRDLESNDWIVKQALDMGLMGVIFNGVENKEQMTRLIRYMRYPQQKTSKYQQPPGLRGYAPGNAIFAWGVSAAEYEKHADVWPLNPEGDLARHSNDRNAGGPEERGRNCGSFPASARSSSAPEEICISISA